MTALQLESPLDRATFRSAPMFGGIDLMSARFVRHTAIHNIEDVDVVCILDLDIHADGSEPEVVLTWLQGVLDKYYSETRPQGRSIGISAKGVWLDIVPGTPVYQDGPLWIPDRDAKAWVQSHPKGQISAASEKNKDTGGYYVQTVKLMKSWRDRLPTEKSKPKSYILETLVHQKIGLPTSHARAVVNVLEGINSTYGSIVAWAPCHSLPIRVWAPSTLRSAGKAPSLMLSSTK
jgi:hypothetical protein